MYSNLKKCLAIILFTVSLLSPVFADKKVMAYPDVAYKIRPLINGLAFPEVSLKSVDGKKFNLATELKNGPAIFIFYRGGWCPFCNMHFAQLNPIIPKIKEMGLNIFAVSPDRIEELLKTKTKEKLEYTLLSDSEMQLASALNIAFRVDDLTIKKYVGYGINLEKASGQKHNLLPVPSIFIVGSSGEIVFSYVNPNYKVRLSPELLMAACEFTMSLEDKAKKQ